MVVHESLSRSVEQTHHTLAERFGTAAGSAVIPGQPRKGFEHTDTFLAAASRHLNAVDAVLLPAVRRHVADGTQLVHDYLHAARGLERALAQAKAREYGEAHAILRSRDDVWVEVSERLASQRDWELTLASRLSEHLDDEAADLLANRLYRAELHAPTRPHPYSPHTGLQGRVARRALHAVDSFWDAAEGRMVPEPHRAPHRAPGLLAQYLLADPQFDEDQVVTRP